MSPIIGVDRLWSVDVERIRSKPGAVLVVLCAVLALDGMDVASMGPALPQIGSDLRMSPDALQWVVSAYVIGYGGFLLLGGRLADLFPRRRLLVGALALFAAASLVGGFADTGTMLIAARLAKGVTAAFTAPTALAILLATYRDEHSRNRALGAFISMGAVGFTSGLVIGGALADVSWRLTLFLPSLLAVLIAVAAQIVVPADQGRAREDSRVDLAGAITVTAAVLLLVFAASRAATAGWGDTGTLASIAGSLVLLGSFVAIEGRRTHPLVPLDVFRRPEIAAADICAGLFQGAYVGFQFIATLYFQDRLGWSPLRTGLAFLIGGVMVLVFSRRFAAAVTRFGAWPVAAAGLAVQTVAYLWFTQLGRVDPLVLILVGQPVMGLGYAATYPALNISAVAHARPEDEGLAGGMFISATQIGSGIALGIAASILTANEVHGLSAYRDGLWAVLGMSAAAALLSMVRAARTTRTAQRPQPTLIEPRKECCGSPT